MLKTIIWEQKKTVIYTIVAGTVSGLTAVALFAQSGLLISKAALMPPFYTILILAAFLKLFGVTKSTSKYAERLLSHKVTFHLMSRIRETYFHKLLKQTSIFTHFKSGDLLERITADVETLQHTFLRVAYPPLLAGAVFLATILFSLIFSWQISLLLMLGYIVSAIAIPYAFAKWVNIHPQKTREHLSNHVTEYLYGYETYKHFNLLDVKGNDVLDISSQYAKEQMSTQRQLIFAQTFNHLMALAVAAAVLFAGASAVVDGTLQGVYLAMLLMVTLTVFDLATPLANTPYYVAATAEATNRLQHITSEKQVTTDVVLLTPIELRNVSFQYENGVAPVYNDVSLTIAQGEKVAIIGESGSGKSTFVHLLLKELQPTSGTFYMNGTPLQHIADDSLFRLLGVQLQHNHFFIGTVRENLLLAKPDASDEEMKQLLAYVELDFELEDPVEEKALNFSGGERQRLAYARILLQKAPVLLLDEPFSSIDVTLKEKLMRDLCKRDDTIIIITHDAQSLQHFHTIYTVAQQTIQKSTNF